MAVRVRPLLILMALLLASGPAWPAVDQQRDEVKIGELAYQGAERAAAEWQPTIDYLNRVLPAHHFTPLPLDLDGVAAAITEHRVEFVISNPGLYVELESRFGASRLATLESSQVESPSAALGATVIARADNPQLARLRDLKGHSLAVVSTEAFGGFQIIWREMLASHVDPFHDLRDLRVVGFPMERVVRAVRDGAADAGVLRACLLEELTASGAIAPGEFRVVSEHTDNDLPCKHSSRLYPDWPLARLPYTPRDLAKSVAAALLTMPPVDGRAWTAPLDYTTVHELFRTLKIGPYRDRGPPSLRQLARNNWQWLVLGLMAVLWWIIHVARVETLVRRRTAELEQAMAERARAERDSTHHREERDRLSRLGIMGEMASNIAHELNQPLAAIANYANGMLRMLDGAGAGADPHLLKDGAQAVREQAERAADIIQRVRGFVRRRPLQRMPQDANRMVREALSLFEALVDHRQATIRCNLAAELPPVMADPVEIQQVLLNLLQNALDAVGDQPGSISVRSAFEHGMVTVAVRDSGHGLSEEAARHLFEPFFTTKPEGLGLGLSICHTIIESHGGRLWAEANDGPGATIGFTLPAADAPSDGDEPQASVPEVSE